MKIGEYEQMMSWLTRPEAPAPIENRENFAIGGGQFEGTDLGTREGFAKIIPVSTLPEDQKKFINNWLKNNSDKKWEELTSNERNMLKRGQNVGVGFGGSTPSGPDNVLFEPLSEKGKKIAEHVYGTTDVPNSTRLRINNGEITMNTKSVKFEKGKDISLKMKRGSEEVTDIVFPDKKVEKDFIKAIKARVLQPQKAVVDFTNKELSELFPISEKQAGRAARFLINKLGLKYEVPTKTSQAEIIKKTKNSLAKTSSVLEESRIRSAKTPLLKERNLSKKIDIAHRVSKKQMERLGLEFNTDTMGIDSRLINQIIVKPSEIKLNKLYTKQFKVFEELKKNPNSTEAIKQLEDINKQVTDIVKSTSGRLVGISIDSKTLEPSFVGMKKKYSFSNVLGKSMTMKELENLPEDEQRKFLNKQLPKAIDLEIKRGFVPNDFKNILSNKNSQKSILNYTKKTAPELLGSVKKAIANPESKVARKVFSIAPQLIVPGAMGYIGYKALGFDTPVIADDQPPFLGIKPQGSPGQLNPETQKGIPEEAIAAGTVGAIKYGPQILKALKSVGKAGLKTVGSLPAAGTFAGMEIKKGMGEGQSFVDAASDPLVGLELLLPETVKKLGPLMARAARISTPIGATITTGGTLKNRAKEMMRQAEGMTALPEGEKQRRLLEEYAAKDYKGYNQGGRVNFADGPEDPKKRKFMKIMGGLASLPIVGRLFDVAQVAEKTAPVIQKTVEAAPTHFWNLVAKIKTFGDDITQFGALTERQSVKKYKDLELTEDMATGQIEIQRVKVAEDMDYYGSPVTEESYMSYRPGEQIFQETANGQTKIIKSKPDYQEGTTYLRNDGPETGSVLDEMSGLSDDIFEEAGVPVPEKIRKK